MNAQFFPIRTLGVDDSESECALLTYELGSISSVELIGFVHDGIEAIAYLQGVEQFRRRDTFPYPDLLLLDFNMPRCGGMGVLEFLRRQLHRPRVVLWSSTLDQVDIPLALHLGADLVCEKPASRGELARILARLDARASDILPFTPSPGEVSGAACVNA